MSKFKLKAKKLIGEMREARNKGNCRMVGPEDENFIAHVQQVMGISQVGGSTVSAERTGRGSEDLNNNKADASAVVDKFRHLNLEVNTNGDAYQPEVALSNFNRKWRSIVCGGSTSGSTFRIGSNGERPGSYGERRGSYGERRGSYGDRRGSHGERRDELEDSSVEDFQLMKTIGKGAFGKVLLVQSRHSGQYYAMKIMNKKSIVTHKNSKGVVNEKRIMLCVSFPFLVQLHTHFKDSMNLYMVMEFVSGGDLFFHLRRRVFFTEKEAKFYGSQIVLALEYLHMLNVVYRDLKPENILICHDGYIKLTDFGLAKRLSVLGKTKTLLGTPEYLAPEIFLQQPYGKSVDWWAFGILLFEMIHGKTPFRSESDADTFQNILSGKYKFAPTASAEFKDLVSGLLLENKYVRLGAGSADEIKSHEWFSSVSWKMILGKQVEPPYVPKIVHRGDTRYFDNYTDNLNEFRSISPEDPDDVYRDTFADF